MKLPKPSASLNTAAQCREMGIHVGDTIEGRETHIDGSWNEARLTLLWLGKEIAVWHERKRNDREPPEWGWTMPIEDANWTLEFRDWHKIGGSIDTELTCAESFSMAPAPKV